MDTKEVKGTYGSYKTPCKVFVCETSAGCWYVVEGSRNVNCTTDSIEDGVDVEVLKDFDTFTSNEAIDSESQLGSEVEGSESYKRGTNVEKKTATKKTAKKKATKKKGKKVPAWVVAKVNRSASDLSDATHYLDGESKMALGGGVGSLAVDIEKAKKALIKKAKSKGIYENFGQKEVGDLEDKYGHTIQVSEFDNWVMNFDLDQLSKYAKGSNVESKSWLDGIEYLFNF